MNAPVPLLMDKQTFFAWREGQDRKYEWVKGRAVLQQMTTRDHANLAMRFAFEFLTQLDSHEWTVLGMDFGVDLGDEVRYPDVMVERFSSDGKAQATGDPVVLVEVLSPSSVTTDLETKKALYTSLPSLQTYIVASQDEPKCWVWQRSGARGRGKISLEPTIVEGADAVIVLKLPEVRLPFATLYRGFQAA